MDQDKSLSSRLKAKALELGFASVGITRADAVSAAGDRLHDWLASGAHGDMAWMEARADQRASPNGLWQEAQSVIALGMSYALTRDPMVLADVANRGRISVYAQGSDYHDLIKRQLKALARWLVAEAPCELKVFVDTAPVMEKPLAAAAGLGWQGKHTNLVSRDQGSWLFLGAIYTTLDLPPDPPGEDRCGSCDACQRACPTQAFPAPYRLDARRCISYLTIEHAGSIPHDLREGIGNHIYGCDDCLSACPWNKFAQVAHTNRAFLPRAELTAPSLSSLLALDDAEFRRVFAGSPVKRTGRNRMVRNAAIAAGNSGDQSLVALLIRLLDDESAIVRGAAIWALSRLAPTRFEQERASRKTSETDAEVVNEWG